MLQQSQENHGSSGKSAHDSLEIDTHYNAIKDVYVPEELKRPHTDVNTVSVEQQGNDYIRPNADLETGPQIRNKEQLKHMYPECFDGIAEFKNFEYHIELDPKFKPRIQTPHKVALSIEPKLKKELDQMEKQGITDKPTGPTEWLNNLIIREKSDGQLHIYLDPKYLNEAIKREHHPIPTLEQITPNLCGSTLFSKLDAKQGYWNVKLYTSLSLITKFHTPFGRYKFLRMPFGLRMGQDILQ